MFSKVNLFSLLLVFVAVSLAKASYAELTIDPSGKVGIGTTSPTRKLDVNGDIRLSGGEVNSNANIWFTTGAAIEDQPAPGGFFVSKTDGPIHFRSGTGNPIRMSIGTDGNVGIGTTSPGHKMSFGPAINNNILALAEETTGAMRGIGAIQGSGQYGIGFWTSLGPITPGMSNTSMYISANNNYVGIGTISPNNPLEMGSGAHVTSGGVWTNASSREYKNNIRNLTFEEAKTALEELTPTRYHYNADNEDEYLGFIAEDVPDLVATKDRKSLSPMDIVAVLTKVVQQQQKKIDALEARFNKNKGRGQKATPVY